MRNIIQNAFKRIVPVHKYILAEIQCGNLLIERKKKSIQTQIDEYKKQNRLVMDHQTMMPCISIYDIFMETQNQKINSKQEKLLIIKGERQLSKQKSESSLLLKEKQYQQKMRQWQKQKSIIEHKKRVQQQRKIEYKKQEEERVNKQKQLQIVMQKQQKKLKLEQGLKQIGQRRKKRQQMIQVLTKQKIRSQSTKNLGNSVPKYIQLERQYLAKERHKMDQFKQQQKLRKQSMNVKIQQIKRHEKQYIQKLKQNFTSRGRQQQSSQSQAKSRKAKSDFNLIKQRGQEEDQISRSKANRRKQFENKLRNIPIHIDPNKRKQKEIQVDKSVHKQKYVFLAKRHLDDEQIFNEFKDFQLNINPKEAGKNYLNQLRQAPKTSSLRKQNSQRMLHAQPQKKIYVNYLEELRAKNIIKKKTQPQIQEKDQLLKLVQQSKKLLNKHYKQQQNIYGDQSAVSLKESKFQSKQDNPAKVKQNQLKAQVTKSITEKISEYQRKVFKKVNDLKRISQYDESIRYQNQIDQLYSKVIQAKLETIKLS